MFSNKCPVNSVIEIKYLAYAANNPAFPIARFIRCFFKLVEISLAEILLYRASYSCSVWRVSAEALRLSVSGGAAETWLAWLLGLYSRAI